MSFYTARVKRRRTQSEQMWSGLASKADSDASITDVAKVPGSDIGRRPHSSSRGRNAPVDSLLFMPGSRNAAAGSRSITRGASNEERRETAENPVVLENSDVPIAVIQICLVTQNAFCVAMITHPKVYHLQLKVILNLVC